MKKITIILLALLCATPSMAQRGNNVATIKNCTVDFAKSDLVSRLKNIPSISLDKTGDDYIQVSYNTLQETYYLDGNGANVYISDNSLENISTKAALSNLASKIELDSKKTEILLALKVFVPVILPVDQYNMGMVTKPTPVSNSFQLQDYTDVQSPSKFVAYLGVGGGSSGLTLDFGAIYYIVGFSVTDVAGESFSAPAVTSGVDNRQFGYVSSHSQRYDFGSMSYELILSTPVTSLFSFQGYIGYYSHTWKELTTTTDEQGILPESVAETNSGTTSSGLSWGAGTQYNLSNTFTLGLKYSGLGAFIGNVGYRF